MSIKTSLMVLSLVVSVAIGTVIARNGRAANGGGGGGAAAGKAVRIGLSLDTEKEQRWQDDAALFEKRAGELGATVYRQSANGDDARQVADVTSLISRGIDVLVVVSHDGKAMAKAVQLAHAEKPPIPVIAYDRLILSPDLDLYLSFDNVEVGRKQGQYVIDHLPGGRGSMIFVYGSKTDNNAFLFKQGQREVLDAYIKDGRIKVLGEDWAEDWRPENGKKIVQAAITNHPGEKLDAVLASADGVAAGVVQALSEEGLLGKVLVTGQDADVVACQRIIGGTQAMTIYKPLPVLAKKSAEAAVALATGRPVVANATVDAKVDGKAYPIPSILNPIFAVDKANIDDTVIKDGFRTREQVYGGDALKPAAN